MELDFELSWFVIAWKTPSLGGGQEREGNGVHNVSAERLRINIFGSRGATNASTPRSTSAHRKVDWRRLIILDTDRTQGLGQRALAEQSPP